MATSESEDFESADEELNIRKSSLLRMMQQKSKNFVDSESDDDTHFIPNCVLTTIYDTNIEPVRRIYKSKNSELLSETQKSQEQKSINANNSDISVIKSSESEKLLVKQESNLRIKNEEDGKKSEGIIDKKSASKQVHSFGVKQLENCVVKENSDAEVESSKLRNEEMMNTEILEDGILNDKIIKNNELDLEDVPEELKYNLKFKDVFKPDSLESIHKDVQLSNTLLEENLESNSYNSVPTNEKQNDSSNSWGSWSSWGVNSLLNTATASVSNLTSRVSQGLTLLEETIGAPDPVDLARAEIDQQEKNNENETSAVITQENQFQNSFDFSNWISGVSSITKLVESTGSRVISGGLDTLETIGKKTMEVLQEGDPGLKKKRAFFMNEKEKPILSQMLREAKERAEATEKSFEERQAVRRVCFESLFDDYQGLVHLEALEMLSKQSNMKIQQKMINLDIEEVNSIQETLDEVKELCDLGDDEEEEDSNEEDFKNELENLCQDLKISVTYDKLNNVLEEIKSFISISISEKKIFHQEWLEEAISALAKFTAYSVERFHKTAELLLLKERRSTVSEADALMKLTRSLSGQIGVIAALFSDGLNEIKKYSDNPDIVSNITSIFLEAANASSYIQEAFRLLIPIIQVGAIQLSSG